jgi:RNA polymerase sigma-70 factor, ECF subfamily
MSAQAVRQLSSPAHPPNDYDLARSIADGAVAAIGELYERHWSRVFAQCMRMTGNVAEAEDLTQEVFVHLMRKIHSFKGHSQFTTWLHRVTVNQVLMHFRRTKQLKEKLATDGELDGALTKSRKQPLRAVVIDRLALESAIARLPRGSRMVMFLFDVEGYKHDEIAAILGCSVGTSKSQLHRARTKLRTLLRTTDGLPGKRNAGRN